MPNGGEPTAIKPPLTRRVKLGIGATVVSLVILVYPGQLALPVFALMPLMPRPGGCAPILAGFVFVAFLLVGLLISGVLIAFGIVAVILAALRKRTGLVGAVFLNAAVLSLLMLAPFGYPKGSDSGLLGLYVILAICALIPLTALVLLLSPALFASWHSRGSFVMTAVLVGLLLLPGVVNLISFGGPVHDLFFAQPAASVSPHTC